MTPNNFFRKVLKLGNVLQYRLKTIMESTAISIIYIDIKQ